MCPNSAPPPQSGRQIGGVRVPIERAARPDLVPRGYVGATTGHEAVAHLRWMAQKDLLAQVSSKGSSTKPVAMPAAC